MVLRLISFLIVWLSASCAFSGVWNVGALPLEGGYYIGPRYVGASPEYTLFTIPEEMSLTGFKFVATDYSYPLWVDQSYYHYFTFDLKRYTDVMNNDLILSGTFNPFMVQEPDYTDYEPWPAGPGQYLLSVFSANDPFAAPGGWIWYDVYVEVGVNYSRLFASPPVPSPVPLGATGPALIGALTALALLWRRRAGKLTAKPWVNISKTPGLA